MDPTPLAGGSDDPPSKTRTPSDLSWFFTSYRCHSRAFNRAFFALVFELALRVTPPFVMRNGSPRKKVVASTCSSSGPAMYRGEYD